METRDNQGTTSQGTTGAGTHIVEPRVRLPYVPPMIVSGEAFERVQLNSGCNEGVEDCEIPC